MMDSFKNINDIAVFLGVKVATVYLWVHTRQIPHYKIGRLVKFNQKEIEGWVKERYVKAVDYEY